MWILFGLLAGLTAALMTISAKIGLKSIDPVLATTVRSIIMAACMVGVATATQKWHTLNTIDSRGWKWMIAAALFGALSWLFYFFGLQQASATRLAALDRLSLPLIVLLSALVLHETISPRVIAGTILATGGILLMTLK